MAKGKLNVLAVALPLYSDQVVSLLTLGANNFSDGTQIPVHEHLIPCGTEVRYNKFCGTSCPKVKDEISVLYIQEVPYLPRPAT